MVLNLISRISLVSTLVDISTRVNSCNWSLIKFPLQNNSLGLARLISLDRSLNASDAFSKYLSRLPVNRLVFFVKIIVLVSIYFKKLSLCSCRVLFSTLGIIDAFFNFSVESCVATSKLLILSISSPKNSIRYGSSLEKEKTSIIPPRTEKSPGSVTKSTRLNLYSNKISFTKSKDKFSPTVTFKVFFSSSFLVTTFSNNAAGYVTIIAGFCLEFILFNTSDRNNIFALSVSSI